MVVVFSEWSSRARGSGGVRSALGAFRSRSPGPAERHRQRLLHQGCDADRQECPVQWSQPPAPGQLQGRQVWLHSIGGRCCLLPVCLGPSYLSASLICCAFVVFSHLHSSPGFTFDPLFYSFLCSSSPLLLYCLSAFSSFMNSPGLSLSVASLCSFLRGLLVFTPLLFDPPQSFLVFLLSTNLPFFFNWIWLILFLLLSLLHPSLFFVFCLGVYVNSFIGHGCGFVFLSFPQHADVRDAREEGALWCNRSGSLR